MKRIASIFLHPLFIALLFCGLIISGESSGAFYIWLLALGLPYGVPHAIIGIVGIALLVITAVIPRRKISSAIALAGCLCLMISLLRFFTQPGGSYNYNTFREAVPLALLLVFTLLVVLFIIKHLQILLNSSSPMVPRHF